MLTAAKITTAAEAALKKWDRNFQKILKLAKQRDEKIAKEREKYDRACAPIVEESNQEIGRLTAENLALESEIEQSLLQGISPDKMTVSVPRIETSLAIAEIKDNGRREIDPQAFFKEIPVAERTSFFWSCVSILVTPAEKFLPQEAMKLLARHQPKQSVVVRAKQ